MALLNFYKGEFSKLDAVTKKEGNVYVTTDEKAIYVDVSNNERIRLGQIVSFDTLAKFKDYLVKTNPPYSKEAFYYVADSNALLKWVSSDGTTGSGDNAITGTWKQINSTSDVQADLTALTEKVTANTAAIATINSDENTVGSIKKALKDAKDYTDTQVGATNATVSGINTRLGTAEGKVTTLEGQMETANEKIAANESAISTNTGNIAANATAIDGVKDRVSTLETTVNDSTNGLATKVSALETAVNDSTNGLAKKVSDLTEKVAANETAISNNDKAIKQNADDIKANTNDITALKTAVGDGADGLANKLSTLTGRVDDAENNIGGLGTRMTDVEGKAQANESAINTINDKTGTVDGSLAKNLVEAKAYTDTQVGATNTTVSSINTRLGTAEGEIDTLQSDMAQAKNDITTNATAIATLNGDEETAGSVKKQIADASDTLSKQIASSINAANAMEYQGNIAKKADLPTLSVKIGDTYVVSTKFVDGNETFHAGDMLIANGAEEDGIITSTTLTWDHVITGYVKEQDDKLKVKTNTLLLQNYLGEINGQLTFSTVAENEAGVIVTMTGTEDAATVTFGMQWGEF